MSNLIQIKRSTTTAAPGSLANGELAYTANGDVLYIGSNGEVVAIAGKRVPGTLTANQALVANSTGYLNEIKTAKLFLTGTANVTHINAVSNSTVLGAASNTEMTTTWAIKTYVDAQIDSAGATQLDGLNDVNLDSVANNNFLVYNAGTTQWENRAVGNGFIFDSQVMAVKANNGLIVNTSGIFVDAANGISVTSAGVNVLVGNNQLVSNSTGVWLNQSAIDHDSLANFSSDEHVAHSGVSISAGDGLTGGGTIASSRTISLNPGTNGGLSANSTGAWVKVGAGVYLDGSGNVSIGQNVNTSSSVTFANVVTTDLTVSGNLTVSGTLTTVDTDNLAVEDSLITLARNQSNSGTYTDALDIGIYGTYGNTSQSRYTGLFRDASDSGIWKLFQGQIPTPTTTVDVANVNYTIATLQAYLKSGALVSNSSAVTLTANSTVAVNITANTLTLSSALGAAYGGTGQNSIADQDLLVGNGSGGWNKLSAGSDGKVLQIVSGSLAWADLDGGTF